MLFWGNVTIWQLKITGRKLWTTNCSDMTVENTRNSSGDEIANVNFLYDDIVHVIQNTIDSCINSATARRGGYVLNVCLPNSVK